MTSEEEESDQLKLKSICKIKCLHCGMWFKSQIHLEGDETYLRNFLVGNKQQCPHCGKMTDCNKENMMFEHREGAKVLHVEGEKTII